VASVQPRRMENVYVDLTRDAGPLPLVAVHARLVERAATLLPERVEDAP
jgi:hypothetical protein